jgi:hypothetical protein
MKTGFVVAVLQGSGFRLSLFLKGFSLTQILKMAHPEVQFLL